MTTPTTPDEAIEQNVLGPKRVQVGNQSVEQHSSEDQIKAARHIASQAAASKAHVGLRLIQLVPGKIG